MLVTACNIFCILSAAAYNLYIYENTDMDRLIEKFRKKIARTDTSFIRSIKDKLLSDSRLIGIKGSRGVGKTTLFLQFIKTSLQNELNNTLYISLDDIWFSGNSLSELADNFYKRGGKYLFIDEVHKHPDWSVIIKNIYDDYPELKIYFIGSSLLEILNSRADLSRRAIVYEMQGLSFREYLSIVTGISFDIISLEDILSKHEDISQEILLKTKPLKHFPDYLQKGYYPFFKEQHNLYFIRLEEVINMILELELPQLRNISLAYIIKIKKLLLAISQSAPFIPNISKLSERIGLNRETLLSYLHYLNESNLIFSAFKDSHGVSSLQKPDKIYLENSNLMFALNFNKVNIGNARETFFINQLKHSHLAEIADKADFIVDKHYTFEIGGKSKSKKQIADSHDAFIAADNIEYGFSNRIPLWLFGFLY